MGSAQVEKMPESQDLGGCSRGMRCGCLKLPKIYGEAIHSVDFDENVTISAVVCWFLKLNEPIISFPRKMVFRDPFLASSWWSNFNIKYHKERD